jgi:tetratricopeptide (TPR) repeat protein
MLSQAITDAIQIGDYHDAIVLLRAEVATSDSSESRYQLAINLQRVGELDESIEILDELASSGYANPMLPVNQGHGFKSIGDADQAEAAYRRALEGDEQLAAIAYWSIADLGAARLTELDLRRINQILESSLGDTPYAALLLFARGNALHSKRCFSEAFDDFARANELVAAVRPFRGDLFHTLVQQLMQVNSIKPAVNSEFAPIFIVGMPRSGTTLVEQILAAHSTVAATDELVKLGHLSIGLEQDGGYAHFLQSPTADRCSDIQQAYEQAMRNYDQHHAHLIDKNPNNFLHIGLIKTLFPKAKIINVVRDPLDNAVGVFRRYFDKGYEFSYSMEGIVFYWQGYISLMQHWDALIPGSVYHLNYEKLVATPKDVIGEVLSHCGLEPEEACFNHHLASRAVLTPSAIQVRQPISKEGLGVGLKYQSRLQPYIRQLAAIKLKSKEVFGFE